MRKIMFACLSFPVLTLFVTAQAQTTEPTRYSVVNLGTLGGEFGSSATSINNKGWIAGVANLSGDTEEHAALWRDGLVTDLGTLGGDNSNVNLPGENDNGLIVGFAQTSDIDPLGEQFCTFSCTPNGGICNGSNQSCRGFRWRNGVMDPLETLGGNNSAATGTNNRGLIVGLAENSTQDPNCIPPQVLDYKPVVWRENTIHELPVVDGDSTGGAAAVNDNNQIVGASGICGSGPGLGLIPIHAVLWQNHSVTDLGNLGGAVNNIAFGINNAGQIVGASDLPGDNTGHAFLWQKGVMSDLGTVAGDVFSIASAINSNGQVVGVSCDENGNCRAFRWQRGMMTDLNTLIPTDSSLYLLVANDINSRGEIVGIAFDQSKGEPVAFAAVPCSQQTNVQGCVDPVDTAVGLKRQKAVLPDDVRKVLGRRLGWGRLTAPQ
jgi:probable HAF family extracellular repeat protein